MFQSLHRYSSYRDFIKALEADIEDANTMADSISRSYGGASLHMKLSYSPLASMILFLIDWMDFRCSYTLPSYLGFLYILVYKVCNDGRRRKVPSEERRASLMEFYAVIYPSLVQLKDSSQEVQSTREGVQCVEMVNRKRVEERKKLLDKEFVRDDECGICMEIGNRIVLPNCVHSMCIRCFHDWSMRSESCPFCRGVLKGVDSSDLWILTSNNDVIDKRTLAKENLKSFHLYIANLPLVIEEPVFFVYDCIL